MVNRSKLDELFLTKKIHLNRGGIFDHGVTPKPTDFDFDKVEGMLLGNDTKDNDTIAAIVGAAVGALHGKQGIPKRWINNLSGRTRDCDNGRIFELIDEARCAFW